jgi:GLPGLI family protein
MKKLITAVAILISAFTYAQKEGSVTYVMTVEGLPPEQAAMMGDMETKVFFKDKKTYTEMNSMMYSYKILNDDNGQLFVVDQMGNKYYTKTTKAELDKMAEEKKDKDPKIEYTNDTKTIAGYECKKAIVTNTGKDGETKTDVWYSEKVPYVSQGGGGRRGGEMFKGLKGMPLEFSVKQGPMNIKMSAKEISFDAVPDSKFVVSTEGYTEKKMEDLKKENGGGK